MTAEIIKVDFINKVKIKDEPEQVNKEPIKYQWFDCISGKTIDYDSTKNNNVEHVSLPLMFKDSSGEIQDGQFFFALEDLKSILEHIV